MQLTTDLIGVAQSSPSAWASAWEFAREYLKPAAVLIPLLSAYFGAKTAQGTADRNKFRDEMTKEIRNTNASISLAFAIANSVMALKRQHVLDLKADFDRGRAELIEFKRKRATGELQGNKPFEAAVNLKTLQVPRLPSATLRSHVLDRLSATGRTLHLAITLDENVERLKEMLERRNAVVLEFAKSGGQDDKAVIQRYFGLDTGKGVIDQTYPDLVDGLASSTDDVIFFAAALCADLTIHGEAMAAKFKSRLRREQVPRVQIVNFETQKANGLMPGPENYDSVMKAFVKLPSLPPTRWVKALRAVGLQRAGDPPISEAGDLPKG